MIDDLKYASMAEAFINGVQKAKQENKDKLVTYTMECESQPLQFYRNSEKLKMDFRHFWSDPEGVTLVGVGSTLDLTADGHSRFDSIQTRWLAFLKEHQISIEHAGTGPVLMGGFSFNPVLTAAEEWTNYPAAAMVLPQFLLTQRENKAWLTVNKRVTPKDDPKALIATIEEQKNMLLADRTDEEGYFQTHQDLQVTALFPTEWKASVQKAVDKMKAGELEKIVLSRALRVKKEGSLNIPALLYRLKQQQPNSFVFAIERFGDAFVGATPERLVKREGTKFYADALAGTASRGGTQAEDEALGQGLLNDKKNRQEHQFVVKMIKDDFEAFCDKVIIPDRPVLYKTRDVQHLYTPIYGHGKPDAHLLDAISKIHPTPAMGGTPKEKAVALISELESHERGWYSAPVGWIDSNGNGEFSVAIRSGLIRGNEARLFAGCGIVSDSSPTEEFKETEMKFRPMLNALKEE